MFTAGLGQMDARHAAKGAAEPGMLVAKIGGPAYRIGLGGGAASSRVEGLAKPADDAAGADDDADAAGDGAGAAAARAELLASLDFNAVQRGDAEMGNKLNRVVRGCVELGADNPIVSIHDQGCGGNGNVLKEIVEGPARATTSRSSRSATRRLTPLEAWGAEYQESNAVLVRADGAGGAAGGEAALRAIAARERCGVDFVGRVEGDGRVVLLDSRGGAAARGRRRRCGARTRRRGRRGRPAALARAREAAAQDLRRPHRDAADRAVRHRGRRAPRADRGRRRARRAARSRACSRCRRSRASAGSCTRSTAR